MDEKMVLNSSYQNRNNVNFGAFVVDFKSLNRLGQNALDAGKLLKQRPYRKATFKLDETKNLYRIHDRIAKYNDIFITSETASENGLGINYIKIQIKKILDSNYPLHSFERNPLSSVVAYINTDEITSACGIKKAIIEKIIMLKQECARKVN